MQKQRFDHLMSVISSIDDAREFVGMADQLHHQGELTPEIQGAISTRKIELERFKHRH